MSNKHDAKVVKVMIVLSQSLGYTVIAEGVETEVQEDMLKAYHCDRAQGYYFAHAMDGQAFYTVLSYDRRQKTVA